MDVDGSTQESTTLDPPKTDRRVLSEDPTLRRRLFAGSWLVVLVLFPYSLVADEQLDVMTRLGLIVVMILCAWFSWRVVGKYRRVSVDDSHLYIASRGRDVAIPLTQITRVERIAGTGNQTRTLSIELAEPCALGSRIYFLARPETDAVRLLQQAARQHRGR